GLDLSGWKADEEAKKHWQPRGWIMHCDGKGAGLQTEKQYGDAEYILDFRFPKIVDSRLPTESGKSGKRVLLIWLMNKDGTATLELGEIGTANVGVNGKDIATTNIALQSAGKWNRLRFSLGTKFEASINGNLLRSSEGLGSKVGTLVLQSV